MWTELQQDIEQIKRDQNISDRYFHAVSLNQWQDIERRIYHKFCKLSHSTARPVWLWEHFKQEAYSVQFMYNWPFNQLPKLVDSSETVWLFLNETYREGTKFWFYEARIDEIVKVLSESKYIDEVYIASKKYEWLLCINHHDVLVATGQAMPRKLKELEKAGAFNKE